MKALLFDLDGTILDRKKSLLDFVEWQVNGMLKNDISDKKLFISRFIELDDNGYVWKDKVYESLIKEFSIKNWSVNDLLKSYELCFCSFSVPILGVIDAIKKAKNMGLKIGLISNGKSPFQERNFNSLGISHLFDVVVISEAVGLRKPDKEIFNYACEKLDVKPSESIFIGDSVKADICGSNNAGMFSIFIANQSKLRCEEANITLSKYSDLINIINNIKNV